MTFEEAKCCLIEHKPIIDFKKYNEALGVAIVALAEIQGYRAIGTPTQIYEKIGGLDIELGKYHSIGTIEEFKALKEKNEPKKPLFSTVNRETAYHCGSCKKFVGFYDTRKYEYCHNCGTKIDWQ